MGNATPQIESVTLKHIPNQSSTNSADENFTPVSYSLVLSVVLLLIVSYLKYHTDKKNTAIDYCLFFLEIPIDLGNVIISVFISYYFLVDNVNLIFIAVFAEIFLMVICMTLRNTKIEMLSADEIKKKKIITYCCVEFILVTIPAIVSYIWILN